MRAKRSGCVQYFMVAPFMSEMQGFCPMIILFIVKTNVCQLQYHCHLMEHSWQEQQPINEVNLDPIPFLKYPPKDQLDPRKQSFCQMLRQSICPYLMLFSFIVVLFIVYLVMFIVPLASGGLNKSGTLLEVTNEKAIQFGALVPQRVYDGQVYRLISNLFLHRNMITLLFSLLLLVYIYSTTEYIFGLWRSLLVFFSSGIAGNLFTCVVQTPGSDDFKNKIIMGSITCSFGLICSLIFYLLINISGFEKNVDPVRKCGIILNVAMLFMFGILASFNMSGTDQFSMIGAGFGGFFLGAVYKTLEAGRFQFWVRIIGVVCFVIWQVVVILVLFIRGR